MSETPNQDELANRFTENDFEILASTVAGLCITSNIRLSETSPDDPFRARVAFHCLFYVKVLLAAIDRALIATTGESADPKQKTPKPPQQQPKQPSPGPETHSAWRRMLPNLSVTLRRITTIFSPIAQEAAAEREEQEAQREEQEANAAATRERGSSEERRRKLSERIKELGETRTREPVVSRGGWGFSLSSVHGEEEKEEEEKEEEAEEERLKMQYAMQMQAARKDFARQRGNLRQSKVFIGFRNQPNREGRATRMYHGLKNRMKVKDKNGVVRKRKLVQRLGVLTAFLERLRVDLTRMVEGYYLPRLGDRVTFTIDRTVDEFMDDGYNASDNLSDAVVQFEDLLDYIHEWEEFHSDFPNKNMNDLNGYVFFLQAFMTQNEYVKFDPEKAGFLEYRGNWTLDAEFGYPEEEEEEESDDESDEGSDR